MSHNTFVTYPELKNIGVLIDFLNTYKNKDTWHVNVDVAVSDSNGETIGTILYVNDEYVFQPGEPND